MKTITLFLLPVVWITTGLLCLNPPSAAATPAEKAATAPAPPGLAQETNAQRNIRFQFDGMPYKDVLERFSQMVGKPLMLDTNIEGTLTFQDPQPYTYAEALDTFNLMLSMKGVMLVESGRYLRLVPLKNLPQTGLKIFRGLDQTGDVRPGEIVTIVLELKYLDAGEVASATTPMLSNAGSVAPLSRGRGLVITDRLQNIQHIRDLLNQLDTDAQVKRQMKTYTLLHSSGAVIADLLNRTFGVSTAPKRLVFNEKGNKWDELSPDPNDYVTAVFDDASRTLVLFGPRDRIELAEELIHKFEDKEGGGAGEVRIYYPESVPAAELANMIRQAVPAVAAPNELGSAAATKARIIVDTALNRLIVAAPIAGQLEAIDALVKKVDGTSGSVPGVNPSREIQVTRVFRPRLIDPATAAQIITNAISRRSVAGAVIPLVNVTIDSITRSIVVTGSPGDVQHAEQIVTQLDTAPTTIEEQQTWFVDAGSPAEAKRLSTLAEQLYQNQVASDPQRPKTLAKILPEPDSGRLIITATQEHYQKIEAILRQLQSKKTAEQPRPLSILTLQHVQVDRVLSSISNLVSEKMADRRFQDQPKPLLIPDTSNNRILLTATAEQRKAIEEIVRVLDVPSEKPKRELAMISLQAKTATEIIPLVTQLLDQTADTQTPPELQPKLMADDKGKQLIVLALTKDQERIQALVHQIESAAPGRVDRQLRGIELYRRKAAEFTSLVQQLYTEQIKGLPEPVGGPATVLAEPKGNRILVNGSDIEIARVEAIIRQLDPQDKSAGKEETRVIRLHTALATELVELVEKSLNARQEQVKVLLDARSNSLVVTGEPSGVEAAAQIIQQLDTKPSLQPRELRILELKAAEATALTPLLTNLFAEMLREQRGPNYTSPTKVVPDLSANRIIVTGLRDEIDQIASLVAQLDPAPEQAGGARVFKLRSANAATLAPVVTSAMTKFDPNGRPIQKAMVSADEKSNSLVVSGSRTELQDAAVIIDTLDSEAAGKGRAFRILAVNAEDPTQLAATVSRVFASQNQGRTGLEEVSITAEPYGKRIIVLAPLLWIDQVEKLVLALDQKSPLGPRQLHLIQLAQPNAQELLPTVRQVYSEQAQGQPGKPATITADESAARLTVLGTKEQADAIRQIVTSLEAGQPVQLRHSKVVEVGRLTDAQRLLPLVQQLYQDRVKTRAASGPADAQIISDGRTGRLLISARQDHLPLIEEIIRQLQTGQPDQPGRENRMFVVGQPGEVERLVPLIQQLYQDQWKDKAETDSPDAQILSDAKSGRIIVSGRPAHLKTIEGILQNLSSTQSTITPLDTRVYDLKTASASELVTTLRALYQEQLKTRTDTPTIQTLFLPDTAANRIVIAGVSNELNRVEELILKLDQVSQQTSGTRVFALKNGNATNVASLLSQALVTYSPYGRSVPRVSVGADPQSNTLIVSGEPKDLQSAAVIVEQLDAVPEKEPRRMHIIPVKSGQASQLASQVTQLFQDQVKDLPASSRSEVLILGDEISSRLIITATEPQILQLQKIIEQLETAEAALPRESKTIEVGKREDAQRLLPLIQQLYQDRIKNRATSGPADAQILSDGRTGRLLISARQDHLKLIEQIIRQLQAGQPEQPGRETRIFVVGRPGEIDRLVPLVQQLYQDQWKDKAETDQPDAQILSDAKSGRLIVSGRSNHIKAIEAILQNLGSTQPSITPLETRVYELKSASAADLATNLRTLYQEQLKNRTDTPVVQTLFLPDANANRIIVAGVSNELNAVEELIQKLDQVSQQTAGTRIFTLKNARAQSVASVLSQALVTLSPYGRSVPRVSVGADDDSNTLIVSGEPKDLQSASIIVEQLDTLPTQEPRRIQIIPLKTGLASEMATRVKQLYQDQRKGSPASNQPEPLILGDDTSNRLILTAAESQIKQIQEIVDRLEQDPEGGGRQIRILTLKYSSANAISTILSQLFQRQVRSTDPGQRIVVTAAPDDRTLAIDAAGPVFNQIENLVKTLDEPIKDEKTVIQTVHLKQAQATSLAQAVSTTISGRGSKTQARQVTVTAVEDSNSLLLQGPEPAVEEVLQIIRDLDKESDDGEIEVRVYRLKNGDAREVSRILEPLLQSVYYSRMRRSQSGRAARPNVAFDEQANALIISGSKAHFKMIEELLPTLDGLPEQPQRDVQIVLLKNAQASEVAPQLESLFEERRRSERPLIKSDTFANSITLIGKRPDLQQMELLIKRLDEAALDTSLQVRLLPVDSIPVDQVAEILQKLYPQMYGGKISFVDQLPPRETKTTPPSPQKPSIDTAPEKPQPETPPADQSAKKPAQEVVIAINKQANALLLSGPTRELDRIEQMVTELSFSFISTDAEFRQFQLEEADPVMVARTISDLFRQPPVTVREGQETRQVQRTPRMTIVPDARTRSVIVRAKPTEFLLLESLIRQLDTPGLKPQLEFRLVSLTNAPPEKLLPLIQQMAKELNELRPGEPVSVTADERSRGLLVVARGTTLNRVEQMIRELDIPAAYAEAEVRMISLKKTSAAQLASILQNLLKPDAQGQITPEARALQEQVRRLKVQNNQGQPILLDLAKPIKILPDPLQAGGTGGNRLILTSTPDNLTALAAVIEMMDNLALTEGVEVKVVALKFADATTVSQTLINVFQQGQRFGTGPSGPAQPDGPSGKALVNPVSVVVDSRSNALFLSGQKESLELALRIVQDLDRELDRFVTEVRLFPLKYATATRLVPLLQSVFAETPTPVAGAEGISTYVTRLRTALEGNKTNTTEQAKARTALVIQADDASNILIVAARTDVLPLIEDVVKKLDIPSAAGLNTVRIYPLQHSEAAQLQTILTSLFSAASAPHLRPEERPTITVDSRANALVVSGNPNTFLLLESLVSQLDTPGPKPQIEPRLVRLTNAPPEKLLPLVSQMVTQLNALRPGDPVSVVADPRSRSLVVVGRTNMIGYVEQMIRELDTPAAYDQAEIRFVSLKKASAGQLATVLQNLLRPDAQGQTPPEARELQEQIRRLKVKNSQGQDVLLDLTKPIRILPDPLQAAAGGGNRLLLVATPDNLTALTAVIEMMDNLPLIEGVEVKVLALKHADATTVSQTLINVFQQGQRFAIGPSGPAQPDSSAGKALINPVSVVVDPRSNALFLSGQKESLDLALRIVQDLDRELDSFVTEVRLFPLKHASAIRLGPLLTAVFTESPTPVPGAEGISTYVTRLRTRLEETKTNITEQAKVRVPLVIQPDQPSNILIVAARTDVLPLIEDVIKKLDVPTAGGMDNMRIYPLKHATAARIQTIINDLFSAIKAPNLRPEERPNVTIDERTNALIVSGDTKALAFIEGLIAQLDSAEVLDKANFQVFPLQHATATKLQDTLQRLLANRPSRIQGQTPEPVTVVADVISNALLVGASAEDMSMVASLIERLDKIPSDTSGEFEILPLAKADARRVAETVQSLYRGGTTTGVSPVVVNVDERINALVVSAGEVDRRRIAELVKKLDTDAVSRVSEIRVFPLKYARADALSTILNTALNTKPPALTEQSPNTQSLLQFITRSEDGQELLTSALKESVLVTPDPRMNSLIVSAPLDYMQLLEHIIKRLDAESPQLAKIKVIALQNADARQMATVLTTLFRFGPTGPAPAAGQRSVQYSLAKTTTPPGQTTETPPPSGTAATLGTAEESALSITVDPRTNSLLVSGADNQVSLAEEIILALDSSPAQERKTEVYRLRNAQAPEVQTALRTFLEQDRQRIIQALGPDAVMSAERLLEREVAIVAEASSNTLLMSANPRYFEEVKQLIEQLDKPLPQVLIQALIAEVLLDKTTEIGMEWTHNGTAGNNNYAVGTDFGVQKALRDYGGFSSAITGSDYTFLLRALQSEGRIEVLSRPQILTADNQPATINVGQRIPLITTSRVTDQGNTINSFTYENVGIILTVTPRISPDGFVRMDVGTTNSALASSPFEISSGTEAPVINERRATTTVSVRSGQSVIIGGLISTTDDSRVKKIPLLGDIPLLGILFRSSKVAKDRKELLIFLTPQVLVKLEDEQGTSINPQTITRDQLEKSGIKDETKKQILKQGAFESTPPKLQ